MNAKNVFGTAAAVGRQRPCDAISLACAYGMEGMDRLLPYLDALDGGDVVRKRPTDGQRPRTFINRKAGLRQVKLLPYPAAPRPDGLLQRPHQLQKRERPEPRPVVVRADQP